MPTREEAWGLLNEYIKEQSLIRHCLSVEVSMRAYARKFGEDEEKWGLTGLIHDFDYERYPDNHPAKGNEILREKDYPEDILEAIMGHGNHTGVERKTKLAKTLFAVDELTGMVMATAYVRPTNLEGMTPKSVKKNMKKKAFAAAINRGEIEEGIEDLAVDRDEHIALIIEAMQNISKKLGF